MTNFWPERAFLQFDFLIQTSLWACLSFRLSLLISYKGGKFNFHALIGALVSITTALSAAAFGSPFLFGCWLGLSGEEGGWPGAEEGGWAGAEEGGNYPLHSIGSNQQSSIVQRWDRFIHFIYMRSISLTYLSLLCPSLGPKVTYTCSIVRIYWSFRL